MKKNLIILALLILGFGGTALALPYFSQTQGLVPGVTGTYYIGTSSPSTLEYKGIFTQDLTVSGTCTGCGAGTFPFTAFPTYNATTTVIGFNGLFSTASSTFNSTFNLPALSDGGLGVNGGLVYSGATTTAGTGLTYTGNQFNVDLGTSIDISSETNLTGGDGLTLTGDDMACDTASGTVFGCLTATNWTTFNNKWDLSSTTIGVAYGGTGSTTLTGILKGNGTSMVTSAVNGTDYTLVSAVTCGAGEHLSALTASGGSTCSADTGSSFNFTATTNYGALAVSTSTPVWFTAGIMASTTANYFAGLTVDDGLDGDASATFGKSSYEWSVGYDATDNSFAIASSTTLGTSNALAINKSTLATTLVSLSLTTDLTVANGGTGLSTFGGTNTVLYTTAADTLTSEAAFTYNPSTDVLTAVNGAFTNATSTGTLAIPVGASVITPIAGNMAIDTTTGQLRWSDVTGTVRVLVPYYPIGFTFASTTPGMGTTTRYLTPARAAITVTRVRCDSSSFYDVSLYDGTNRANLVRASSTVGTFTYTTNNTFTANEPMRVDIGTTTAPASQVYLSCGFDYDYMAD